jgi:Siderophore-interacting protein/Siderophore-interacting FAD-binding domain
VTGPDGTCYVDPASGAEGRNYSVRHHNGDCIQLDVVLHAYGVGTTWAVATRPGDRVGLDHARSWYRPEPTTEWQLLVADLSRMPAAARIIEELPAGPPAIAILEVADHGDLDYLPPHPDVTIVPSIGTGNGYAPSQLAHLVQKFMLADVRGYCWFAGEATESRTVRTYFRGLGWSIDQVDIPATGDSTARFGTRNSPPKKASLPSTSAPWQTARATKWPPMSSTKHPNGSVCDDRDRPHPGAASVHHGTPRETTQSSSYSWPSGRSP